MTARDFLIGLGLYVGVFALAMCWQQATKPTACPRGHRDHYHLNGWRCRECQRVVQVRRLRRLARGRDLSRW